MTHWHSISSHGDFYNLVNSLATSRVARIMGTLRGAVAGVEKLPADRGEQAANATVSVANAHLGSGSTPPDSPDANPDLPPAVSDEVRDKAIKSGLVVPIHKALRHANAPLVLVLGSRTADTPLDEPPTAMFAHLFACELSKEFLKARQPAQISATIRITFVPDDILLAHFLFDDHSVAIVPTITPQTVGELAKGYAGLAIKERETAPATVRRLTRIFDMRFREQCAALGEETWQIHGGRDGHVTVTTPFWKPPTRGARVFNETTAGVTNSFQLGKTNLERLGKELLGITDFNPPVER